MARIFYSTTCSQYDTFGPAVDEMTSWGLRNIELSGNLRYEPGIEDQVLRRQMAHQLNFLMHHYFPPPQDDFVLNLASADPAIKVQTFALIRRAFGLMNSTGIPLFGVHGGHNVDMQPTMENLHFIVDHKSQTGMDEARCIFYAHLDEVRVDLKKISGRLAIENLCPKNKVENYGLMSTPSEIETFVRWSLDHAQIGLLLDLGHLNVAGHFLGFDAPACARHLLSAYPHKIFELHLSSNDGSFDVHKVHPQDSWQLALLDEFASALDHVPVVFEWSRKTNTVEDIRHGISAMQERFACV